MEVEELQEEWWRQEPKFQKREVFVEQHPVINLARLGDLIRVMSYVEDAHGLVEIRAFQISLLHKSFKYPSTRLAKISKLARNFQKKLAKNMAK